MKEKQVIKNSAKIFKLLGDESKLSILYHLSKEELNVSAIVERTGIEQSNVSHHLKTLKENRLLASRREGKSMVYYPNDHHIYEVISQVFEHVIEPH